VSSVQVLTSSPVVESWGHFPASRRRLLALLRATHPPAALILSGDVHFAELLGSTPRMMMDPTHVDAASDAASDATSDAASDTASDTATMPSDAGLPAGANVVEVTSSGLTHSCGGAHGALCSLALRLFSSHRAMPELEPAAQPPSSLWSPPPGASVGINFGTLRFHWDDDAADGGIARRPPGPHVHVRVHDQHGQTAFSQRIPIGLPAELESARWQAALDMATIFDGATCLRAPAVLVATALLVLVPMCCRQIFLFRRAPRRQQQRRRKPQSSAEPLEHEHLGGTSSNAAYREKVA